MILSTTSQKLLVNVIFFFADIGAIYLDSDINTVRKVFCRLAFDETVSGYILFCD